MNDLYRLVYTSVRNDICNDSEIENILKSCKKNNPPKLITGVLMHSDRRFLQIIEGSFDEVTRLFELIQNDPRHGGINKRYLGKIDKRDFPDWHMGYKDISTESVKFNTTISADHRNIYEAMMSGKDESYNTQGMSVLKMFMRLS